MGIDATIFEAAEQPERSRLIELDAGRQLYKLASWRLIGGLIAGIPVALFVFLSIDAVAGQTTTIDVTLVATFALTGVAGLAWKVRLQRNELKRLRERNTQLERENLHLKNKALAAPDPTSKEDG